MMEQMGGPSMAGIGFAMGIERLLMVMAAEGIELPSGQACDFYAASIGDKGKRLAFHLANLLRQEGFAADSDLVGRSLKAQMKYADKIGARFSSVLGDDEADTGSFNIKNMADGTVTPVTAETFIDTFYKLSSEADVARLTDALEGAEQ